MVRLVFYPLFTEEENLFSPLKALDHLSTSVLSALRQAESKRKQASADPSSNCVCIRGDSPSSCRRKRPLSEEESSRSAVDSAADDDSKFVVNCNVRGYKPEEISVKAIGDCVEVSAKHEEDSEDGSSYVKREFTQRFTLPEGVKAETVTCALSSSGVLAIEAPKPEVPSKKPRMIPITVESSKPIEAASEEANKEAEKQGEGAPEAASES
ncbi:alpha-crystallin A chain [Rhipicephalus microplus]|uniref:alpha-crystallin A chain n=1 Tax=Rhipicephalus microplus TaxID=6941 RepID=UPI003F6D01FE